jgi:hypothetical protein
MALYGNNFYNLFTYGREALVEFDAQPFIANSPEYASIQLSWALPSGEWDTLLLVRNALGFPVTPDDGDLLLETTSATSYLDRRLDPITNTVVDPRVVEGKTYYYSIFVNRTSDGKWFLAGLTMGTAVKNYGTADLMYSYLPFMYRASSINGLSSDTGEINSDLYNFIRLFAFEYDKFKTDAENVKARYDIANLNGRLIPVMMDQFGFRYEQGMGLQQGRRLLQNAINIYNTKGSAAGLKTFVAAFSGYNATLAAAKNLMLNVNDSSFETSVGGWSMSYSSSATLSSVSGLSESPVVTPYLESTSPSNYPNATSGILKVQAEVAVTAAFACGVASPTTKGIPVTAGEDYTFTIYSRGKTTTRSISTNIDWYDRFGELISSGTAVTTTNSTTTWKRTTKVTSTAPEDAYFAVPTVWVVGIEVGEIHYFDAAQFEAGSSATSYVDARRIDIKLGANRINEVINPSFTTNTNNWTVFSGSLARTTGTGAFSDSDAWGNLTASSGSPILKPAGNQLGGVFLVSPNTPYTFSAYLKSSEAGDSVKVRIVWLDNDTNTVDTYNDTYRSIATSWGRYSATATSPENAVKAIMFIDFTSVSGRVLSVDAVMFEANGDNLVQVGSEKYILNWSGGTPLNIIPDTKNLRRQISQQEILQQIQ